MEVEKRGAKGGFFQLFDWNGKSRKKLFSNRSELPESSNQGKENFYSSALVRHQQAREDAFASGARNHNDYHYASSASGDSEYETKAPGVVARLMGLDSLPKSNGTEPCLTPFIEPHSFRDPGSVRATPAFQTEHDIVIFESVRNKLDGSSRNPLDLRLQKTQNRPIERFQSEVLPPKSAKPISVTHNRLLSPIKSPGFIPPKNAAYIMEAATKIIEHSPRASNKGKLPSIGSSSLPYRVRGLKEKLEAAQRPYQPANTSQMVNEPRSLKKKQVSLKGERQSEGCSYAYKGPEESKRADSQRSKSGEKPRSLAVQAKTNTQKRDTSTSVGYRNTDKQKEHTEVKSGRDSRNVTAMQKKKENQGSSRRPPEVLRPNHQKQNSASSKDRECSDTSSSHLRDKKEANVSSSYAYGRPNRTVNKIILDNEVTSRKTNRMAGDPGKELSSSSSRMKTQISKKKVTVNGNYQSGGIVSRRAEVVKDEESATRPAAPRGDSKWDKIEKKSGSDVVSFTFTSPIKKSGARSNYLGTGSSCIPNHDPFLSSEGGLTSSAASSGFNAIGGDSLSVLLEQKLKELTSRVELSQQDLSESGTLSSSSYSYGDTGRAVNSVNSMQPMNLDIHKDEHETLSTSDFPSTGKLWLSEAENKGREYVERDGNNCTVESQGRYNFLGSGSLSSLPSFSGASSYSYDDESSLQCASLESYGGTTQSFTTKSHPTECDAEISDTASSLSATTISETVTSSLHIADSIDSSYWEFQYISNILGGGALMWEEFALGQTNNIIAPELFDQLENQKTRSNKDTEERLFLERKVLFDCVSECLETRSERALNGSWSALMLFCTRKWLAEEIYRDISGWTNDEEMMVDELVEKDMSSKIGKWTDFDVEAFEEGVEIENRILTCLVDEVIDDFLF